MPAKLAKTPPPARANCRPAEKRRHPGPGSGDIADRLLAWYERHARVLPWRVGPKARGSGARPDPYRVWLSEVMLQQTTVKAVAPYFLRFVERWPNVTALAAAADGDVMAAWAGLGYYSRARNLIQCARAVAGLPGARFPRTASTLADLPGIGAYTSAAIAAIAFDEPAAVVDGNVERVVARLFAIESPLPAAKPLIRQALEPLVPADHAGAFAEATMDLGATICTPKKPACALCPLDDLCVARERGIESALPAKAAKKARPTRAGTAFVARRADGAILLRQRPPRGLLGGMSEVPGTEWLSEPPAGKPPLEAEWRAVAKPVEHVFTHFALRLSISRAEVSQATPAPAEHWWATRPHEEALPSVMKKAIEAAYPGAAQPQTRKPQAEP